MKHLSRKVTVIVLLIVSIAVLGVGGYIIYQIQNSQAPISSNASGFGAQTTTNLYIPLAEAFGATSCEDYFNTQLASGISELGTNITITSKVDYETLINYKQIVLSCIYTIDATHSIQFQIVSNNKEDVVFASQQALVNSITSLFLGQRTDIEQGRIGDRTTYTFGITSQSFTPTCTGILFDDQNDFKYATFTYTGYAADCSDASALNLKVMPIFNTKVVSVVVATTSSIPDSTKTVNPNIVTP